MNKLAKKSLQKPKLDQRSSRTLRAIVLRILPSQDGIGAAEAGCSDYVLRAMTTRLKSVTVAKVERGLAFADSLARQMCEAPFAEVPANEQDRVLRQLQRTPHPTVQYLFHCLVTLTLEAFLCDPRHGGNRDRVGWNYLGIQDPNSLGSAPGGGSCTTS